MTEDRTLTPADARDGADAPQRVLTVLLVEDDRLTREMLGMALEDAGYSVLAAEDVAAMLRILAVDMVDLAVVDLSLPDGSSLDALMTLGPDNRPPVLCMSSHDVPSVRVDALQRGADDFLGKPVVESELIARLARLTALRAAAAHTAAASPTVASPGTVTCAGWTLDPAAQRLTTPQGDDLPLTSGEFRLLLCLVRNPGRPLAREWLTETVIGRPWRAEDRSIDVMVGRLRRKMDLQDDGPLHISSVRYLGYRLDTRS